MGIEPTPSAWKAEVLPLNYTRMTRHRRRFTSHRQTHRILPHHTETAACGLRNRCLAAISTPPEPAIRLVEGGGFEPPKAEPADLQSAPFDRSGIPPREAA